MPELVQIRQRIKTIETIQKITHAMRLVAMSAHSRFKKKEASLSSYLHTITTLFEQMASLHPTWHHPALTPPTNHSPLLVLLIGAQKGLCGNFNSNLISYFTQHMARYAESTFDVIVIGKKTIDLIKKNHPHLHIIQQYETVTLRSLFAVSQELATRIITAPKPYSRILVFSNELKSFFIQKPTSTILLPFELVGKHTSNTMREEYLYEHDISELLTALAHQCLEARILHLLFSSLHAEQAARFFSMDNATRNAASLLETSKLTYNKLRQAKITKELTELTGSL